MITEGEAAILLETTRRAFRNKSQSKQRSTLDMRNRHTELVQKDGKIDEYPVEILNPFSPSVWFLCTRFPRFPLWESIYMSGISTEPLISHFKDEDTHFLM